MPQIFPDTTAQSWAMHRHKGTGPEYVKIGRLVYYRRAAVEAWIEGNTYTRPDRPVTA